MLYSISITVFRYYTRRVKETQEKMKLKKIQGWKKVSLSFSYNLASLAVEKKDSARTIKMLI